MKIQVATLVLVVATATAHAVDQRIIGDWCLVGSVSNGYDLATRKYMPRTKIYQRGTDCPVAERLKVGRKGLRGHNVELDGNGQLIVD